MSNLIVKAVTEIITICTSYFFLIVCNYGKLAKDM